MKYTQGGIVNIPRGRPKEIMNRAEAARLLQVSEITLYRLTKAGRIPSALKVGGQWRYSRAGLIEWVRGAVAAPVGK